MLSTLLQLSLCCVVVVQTTSAQLTYDALREENCVSGCINSDQVLSQLVVMIAQLQQDISQLQRGMSQLQSDVAELKTGKEQRNETGYSTTRPLWCRIKEWNMIIVVKKY